MKNWIVATVFLLTVSALAEEPKDHPVEKPKTTVKTTVKDAKKACKDEGKKDGEELLQCIKEKKGTE